MFLIRLGLEDPFQYGTEEVEDSWRFEAAEWEELVAPPCSTQAEL